MRAGGVAARQRVERTLEPRHARGERTRLTVLLLDFREHALELAARLLRSRARCARVPVEGIAWPP